MCILAIESATNVASVALVTTDTILAEISLNTGKTHSQRLMPLLAKMMEEAELELADLDGIAVSGGPGSFTGLRIGMATAKGLAYASQKPLILVSTLDSLAYNYAGSAVVICPILNARKNEVYTALYKTNNDGDLEEIVSKRAVPPKELVELIKNLDEEVIFLGDGVPIFGDFLLAELGQKGKLALPLLSVPRAATLGWLGLKKYKKGETADLAAAKPFYIRPSEAEVKWKQKKT